VRKWILFIAIVLSPLCGAQHLPPRDFFILDGQPNVLLIVQGDTSAKDILLISSVAARIGRMAYETDSKENETVVWEGEHLFDFLYYDDDGVLPYEGRFNRGNVALGYTGVQLSLGVGGSNYIPNPTDYGNYDYLGANSVDGDWGTFTYLASGSFWFWPDDNYFTVEFVEEKEIDRIVLAVGHMGNYRLQYGYYDIDCARWIWKDILDLHEGTPSGPPPALDPLGNIVGNSVGQSVRKYFFSPLQTKAVRLLITPTDLSGIPHQLYEFQIYGDPFSILYSSHYYIDFWKDPDRNEITLKTLDFWVTGIVPTPFSDFMETRGHSWRSPPNGYFLFDRQISPLRLWRNPVLNQSLLFFGMPHNHTFQMKEGEETTIDGVSVSLADVDQKENKVALSIKTSSFEKKVFIPTRGKKKVAGELFVDASGNIEARQEMYNLAYRASDNMVVLEYHPDVTDPLHDTVLNTSMWWHTQNSTSRAATYWGQFRVPPPIYPFAVFEGAMLDSQKDNFEAMVRESFSPPSAELIVNGDVEGRFVYVSGAFRLLQDFSKTPTELHLKYILYERNVMYENTLHDYVVRGIVEEADTVFQNHTKADWWSYHRLASDERYLFQHVFDLQNCDWSIKINNPANVGVAVILQRYECSLCPQSYDIPREILNSSSYDKARGEIYPPASASGEQRLYPTFEIAEDLDGDGEKDEVVFAIESTSADIGASGEKYATFNAYTLTDTGTLSSQCCFSGQGEKVWDLFIYPDRNPSDFIQEGSVKVALRDPLPVSCEGGGVFPGPQRYFKLVLETIHEEEKAVPEISEHHTFSSAKFLIQKIDFTPKPTFQYLSPATLVRFDYELSEMERVSKNFILFGRENRVVVELRKKGISRIDWEKSSGDLEYIENTWGHGVLIVAGGDGEGFRRGVSLLLQYLETLS
jgi:hypothetical protein